MKALKGLTIGFIGTGKMGQALIRGLRGRGIAASAIIASDADRKALRQAGRRFGIRTAAENADVVKRANVIVLAVKPQQFPMVLKAISGRVSRRQVVVSIAAGITLRWLSTRLKQVPLVRVMPNLPATVGCGFSAIAFGAGVSARQKAAVKAIFAGVGEVMELSERYFDAVTAVSGSGPAYVFFLVDCWQQAARTLGLSAAVARRAIEATLAGSAALLCAGRDDAAALIGKVASKGGTTEAALKVLAKQGTARAFREAIAAAAVRSKQLSWAR